MTTVSTFAAAEAHDAASGGLIEALGINWQLLIVQIVAFLLLVALLRKFVYPWLVKSIDERQKSIEETQKAQAEARDAAHKNKLEVEALLERARAEAAEIVQDAKQEGSDIVAKAETKARDTAERIASEASAALARDVEAAKQQLRAEAADLVAAATEKVIGSVHTSKPDAALIEQALEGSR